MPTVLRIGPYRFFFYSHETTDLRMFMLNEIGLPRSSGWKVPNWHVIMGSAGWNSERYNLIEENRTILLEKWHGYFGTEV